MSRDSSYSLNIWDGFIIEKITNKSISCRRCLHPVPCFSLGRLWDRVVAQEGDGGRIDGGRRSRGQGGGYARLQWRRHRAGDGGQAGGTATAKQADDDGALHVGLQKHLVMGQMLVASNMVSLCGAQSGKLGHGGTQGGRVNGLQ